MDNFIILWLSINMFIPAIIMTGGLLISLTEPKYCKGKTIIGAGLLSMYSFAATLIPSLCITALIKYIGV